jgi:hypothetical protein
MKEAEKKTFRVWWVDPSSRRHSILMKARDIERVRSQAPVPWDGRLESIEELTDEQIRAWEKLLGGKIT